MQIIRWDKVPAESISEGVSRQVAWGGNGTLARFQFAKGVHVSPHQHAAEQFTCVITGSMRLRVGKDEIRMRSGDIFVVPSSTEHEVWVLEESEVIDFFSPARDDWRTSEPLYLHQA